MAFTTAAADGVSTGVAFGGIGSIGAAAAGCYMLAFTDDSGCGAETTTRAAAAAACCWCYHPSAATTTIAY